MSEPPDVQAARAELAEVARQVARLLAQPRHDEAELAELDARANALRERIRQSDDSRRERTDWMVGRRIGRMTSGG